ncbi:fam-l protein [Plasmodium malariae]|uniref:Fam-l protein n=1 Tax=Plasmodium malariae TaxID=5858 RepID=A0A1D3JJU0_PLAMA|nr:fam-l protein [Plasmodium malariae]SBT86778.1 fam-l protein [Plasmodium malariae]
MMEQKIRLFLFIKISFFTLLGWICHFYSDMCSLNKNLVEKCNLCRKLNTRNYRLLEKSKKDKDLCVENFKEMPNNELKEKKCISNNKKGTNEKHNHSCRSSLYIDKYGENVKKNKCVITKTKKYSNFEEKIFKELDYRDYLKNVKMIKDKEYGKLVHTKRRIRIALLLLLFLVLILPVLDLSLEKLADGGLLGLLGLLYPTKAVADPPGSMIVHGIDGLLIKLFNIGDWGPSKAIPKLNFLFYCIPFLIFVVIFILGMVYYYKKVIKYENIKFRKRLNKK